MILVDLLAEADIADKLLKDPQRMRQLMLALKHDSTLPKRIQAALGPKHTEAEAAKLWSDVVERSLSRTNYGDLSRDFKFADYLTKLYATGSVDFEDITGQAADALGAWNALSIRKKLKPTHNDLNRFSSLATLQKILHDYYSEELKQIQNADRVERMKKDAKSLTLIDDPRYKVEIPLNYGACYVWNNTGHASTFCTGSSSEWQFDNYARRGPIVTILDKSKPDEMNGKWQMSSAAGQLHNSRQISNPLPDKSSDQSFAILFPGLMRRIVDAMRNRKSDIEAAGTMIQGPATRWDRNDPWKVDDEIQRIKAKFPHSWASRSGDEPEDEPGPEAEPVQQQARWYQQYLHPEFRNNVPDIPEGQNMVLKAVKIGADGARKSISGRATSMDNLLDRIREQKPDWLQDGSLITVGPAD